MKRKYNKPSACIKMMELYGILSSSENPKVNVYSDESYSPENAYARRYSDVWEEDIEEVLINY